ncbi:MAG: response regulator [Leptolyngbyaceae cyanobacterium bins.349]|nr:response regulator [Leptolyngbyaceae cyanobacterium bins.349]
MKKILVIEDDELVRENLLDLLELEGFEVICADTGAAGLAKAQAERPDLVISDIMMPGLNGYELLTALRQDPAYLFVPFIFLSAQAEKNSIRQGMNLGADDYLTKPFDPNELLAVISTRLAKQSAIAQLQNTIQQLQQLNESNEDALSVLSHDLRSPLTNMQMVISLLKTANSVDQQQSYLKILQDECVRELELINDVLDLQRLESDSALGSVEAFNLYDCLSKVLSIWQARMQESNQAITFNKIPDIPTVVGDRHSLERILTELLSNACKYSTPAGHIIVDLHCTPVKADAALDYDFTFSISNPMTLSETELPNLFKKFYRASNATSSKQPGTGLGLAILEKLVKKLQGSIAVTRHDDRICFTVDMPLKAVDALQPLLAVKTN